MTLDEGGHTTMGFSRDPTARGDDIADHVRQWYEVHRESWWERHRPGSWHRRREKADNFMLELVSVVIRINDQAHNR